MAILLAESENSLDAASGRAGLGAADAGEVEQAAESFLSEFPRMDPRTRSITVATFSTIADRFPLEALRSTFCIETTLDLADLSQGRILAACCVKYVLPRSFYQSHAHLRIASIRP